ncbi:MAG TPA: TAXI family TRAP transporter solute-binding subunit [Dongiaceae bacterium]|nr:TAXI family TRAP transporter solute-binding subunit [Dongiaceae bacterium]
MSRNWLNRLNRGKGPRSKGQGTPRYARLSYRIAAGSGLVVLAIGLAWLDPALISPVNAQDVSYFRIATGGPGSQSFEIAGDISKAISNPSGATDCDVSENCGVPGVIGIAQTTSGGVESLKLLKSGGADGAIVQANMAALAIEGKGPFKSAGPDTELRAIATVGDTTLQVIAPDQSSIDSFSDLKGRRIAIGTAESDSAISVNQIFTLLGIADKKTKLIPLSIPDAAAQLIDGKVDAIAIMDRKNAPAIMAISDHMTVRLVTISPAELTKIGTARHDFVLAHLPAGTDGSSRQADTLISPILFVVPASTKDEIAADLARSLVVPKPGAKTTANPAAATSGAHIESTVLPLHPGVQRLLQTTN